MTESELNNPTNPSEPTESTDSGYKRQGMKNFWVALKHINEASVADSVKQRFSDYVTIALVVFCILSLVAAVALPVPAGLKLLPLLFTIGAVVFYIINRLGIVVSLSQRQALIVWQILIAAFWLGVTSAMLVMMACVFIYSQGSF
jgi:hypothetical protein